MFLSRKFLLSNQRVLSRQVKCFSSLTRAENRYAGTQSPAEKVGIVGTDIYFPSRYVSQADLEVHDGKAAGKYTIGLGQTNMAVAGPQEDINSMCLSALSNLMEKYEIDAKDIGFLGVGTETLVDKSKSTKTVLMNELFRENTDVEGVTTINACYGGTAALFHALDWVESSAWDGRYAVVLAGDIAVYEAGPARPTGGAGVVAMLIGPNAPLVMERGLRASHFEDVYDFYKPTMTSEYPTVDGKLSNACYIRAIDTCYRRYADKYERINGETFDLSKADHSVFHLPYTKLVQKSFARLKYNDYFRNPATSGLEGDLGKFNDLEVEETYVNRDLEKACLALTKEDYEEKVFPSTFAGRNLGNMYCGSLYGGLLALIANHGDNLLGQRIMMFSYGSGLAATMFSLKCEGSVEQIRDAVNLHERLDNRTKVSAKEFNDILQEREEKFTELGYSFDETCDSLAPGSYHLVKVDDLHRRIYSRVAPIGKTANVSPKSMNSAPAFA